MDIAFHKHKNLNVRPQTDEPVKIPFWKFWIGSKRITEFLRSVSRKKELN